MINTQRLKELTKTETVTVTLADNQTIPVATLPAEIQQAVAVMDEWVYELKALSIREAQIQRAINSIKADMLQAITTHLQKQKAAEAEKNGPQASDVPTTAREAEPAGSKVANLPTSKSSRKSKDK